MVTRAAGAVLLVVGACAPKGSSHAHVIVHASIHRTTMSGAQIGSVADVGPSYNSTLVGGLITLGVSYLATVAGGQIAQASFDPVARAIGADDVVSDLWIPVVGPWLALAQNEGDVRQRCDSFVPTPGIGLSCNTTVVTASSIGVAVGGIAQAVGVVLTIAGAKDLVRGRHARADVAVVPTATPGGGGLAILGRF